MKIGADASALIAEALRDRGRHIIEHPGLDLYIAAPTWSEVEHEIGRRIGQMAVHGRVEPAFVTETIEGTLLRLRRHITIVAEAEYHEHEAEARARIPRDPNDWPTVALALALNAGIWTNDYEL